MDTWEHSGRLYGYASFHPHTEDGWAFELSALGRTNRAYLGVIVPDPASQPARIAPRHADPATAFVRWDDGMLPWPLVRELASRAAGAFAPTSMRVLGTIDRARNPWRYGERQFECNSFYFGEHDSWCYELYELHVPGNDFVDVKIPDRQPGAGPFVPYPADRAVFIGHGGSTLPWLVFAHFIGRLDASGDLIYDR